MRPTSEKPTFNPAATFEAVEEPSARKPKFNPHDRFEAAEPEPQQASMQPAPVTTPTPVQTATEPALTPYQVEQQRREAAYQQEAKSEPLGVLSAAGRRIGDFLSDQWGKVKDFTTNTLPANLQGLLANLPKDVGRDDAAAIGQQVSSKPAIDPTDQQLRQGKADLVESALQHQSQSAQKPFIRSYKEVNGVGDLVDYLGSAIAQTVPQVALSVGTAGVSSIAQETGNAYIDQVQRIAEKNSISPRQVIEQGLDNPAISLATGLLSGSMDAFAAGKLLSGLRSKALSLLAGAGIEGGTEALQNAVTRTGTALAAGDNVAEALAANPTEYVDEGLMGALGGSVMTAATPHVGISQEATQPNAQPVLNSPVIQPMVADEQVANQPLANGQQAEPITALPGEEAVNTAIEKSPQAGEEMILPDEEEGMNQPVEAPPVSVERAAQQPSSNSENVNHPTEAAPERSEEEVAATVPPPGDPAKSVESARHNVIADHLTRFPKESFARHSDLNNLKGQMQMQANYFRKDGLPLDVQAQQMSYQMNPNGDGTEISPQDIVEFVNQYPGGVGQYKNRVLVANGQEISNGKTKTSVIQPTQRKPYNSNVERIMVDHPELTDEDYLDIMNQTGGEASKKFAMSDIYGDLHFDEIAELEDLLKERINERKSASQIAPDHLPGDAGIEGKGPSVSQAEAGSQAQQIKAPPTQNDSAPKFESFLSEVLDQSEVKPVTDFIRSLKIKTNNKALSQLVPYGHHIYNGALEIVATSVEAGNSLRKAINAAIRYLKANGVSDEQTTSFESQFRDSINGRSKTDKTLQRTIDNSFQRGQTKQQIKQGLSELRKDIQSRNQSFQQGIQEGKQQGKAIAEAKAHQLETLKQQALSYLKINTRQLSGRIGTTKAQQLVSRINAVKTNQSLERTLDYIDRLIDDIHHDKKLSQANSLYARVKAKSKVKGKESRLSVNDLSTVRDFLQLKPSLVADLDHYNEIAGQVLANFSPLKASTTNAVTSLSNATRSLSNQEIEEYTAKELTRINQEKTAQATPLSETDADMDNLTEQKAKQKRQAKEAFLTEKMQDVKDSPEREGLTTNERRILDNLLSLDVSKLTDKQLSKLNDVLDNFTFNGSLAGAGELSLVSQAQTQAGQLLTRIKALGFDLGQANNFFVKGFASLDLAVEAIAKSTKGAALMQQLLNISAIANGNARRNVLQDTYVKEFEQLLAKMPKDRNGEPIRSGVNRYRRGVYAFVSQHYGGDEQQRQAEFNRLKGLVEQTAKKLGASDLDNEKTEGKIVQQVYDELLANAQSIEQVKAKMTVNNVKIVEWVAGKFEARKDLLKESSELFNNEPFEEVHHYTATAQKAYNAQQRKQGDEVDDLTRSYASSRNVDRKQSGTTITRSRPQRLRPEMVMDFDFDSLQSEKYAESNYDIETQKERQLFSLIINDPSIQQLLGTRNKQLVRDSVINMVKNQQGSHQASEVSRKVNAALNVLSAKGARIALGGVLQFFKQYPSIAAGAMVNLGTDAPLFFKALTISNKLKLFEQFSIGQRGDTKAGYNKELALNTIDRSQFANRLSEATDKVKALGQWLSDKIFTSLVASDVSVARSSWLAYYMQDLKRQGVDLSTVDWQNEHLKANEEAAAYAEQMVSRTQSLNDKSKQAEFFTAKGDGWDIIKNVAMPFSGFAVNQRVRMTNDAQKLLYGGNRSEAARSLIATVAELAVFNGIKLWLIAPIVTGLSHSILRAFDFEPEDKEGQPDAEKFWGSFISDFFFSGLGTLPQSLLNKGLNLAYATYNQHQQVESGKPTTGKPFDLIYQYHPPAGQPDFTQYGIYGILPQKLYETYNTGKYAIGTPQRKDGSEVVLSANEKNLMRWAFLVDALGVVGVSDSELSSVMRKARNEATREVKKKYGIKGRTGSSLPIPARQ